MKKENDFTAREIILAKSDIVRAMPEYRTIPTFDEWAKNQWRFDPDQYANDTEYAKRMNDSYATECREWSAFNFVLERFYQTIA